MRVLEQFSQNIGLLVQNQANNVSNGHDDPQAVMAKKIATLKPPTFVGKEDPMLLENWLRDMEKIFTANGTPEAQKVAKPHFTYVRMSTHGGKLRDKPLVTNQTLTGILLRLLLEVDSSMNILGDKSAVNSIG